MMLVFSKDVSPCSTLGATCTSMGTFQLVTASTALPLNDPTAVWPANYV